MVRSDFDSHGYVRTYARWTFDETFLTTALWPIKWIFLWCNRYLREYKVLLSLRHRLHLGYHHLILFMLLLGCSDFPAAWLITHIVVNLVMTFRCLIHSFYMSRSFQCVWRTHRVAYFVILVNWDRKRFKGGTCWSCHLRGAGGAILKILIDSLVL